MNDPGTRRSSKRGLSTLILASILSAGLTSCAGTVDTLPPATLESPALTAPSLSDSGFTQTAEGLTPPGEGTQVPVVLATAVSLEPAAGICVSPSGEEVIVAIYPDMPDPRCARVTPDQSLRVKNLREEAIAISIGPYQGLISPGEEFFTGTPFGHFLAPGVHRLEVQPCCAMELWLVSNP
ncbi:MAG TPA: hypothetical protein VJ768_08690 [Anaerolineales bacterium]|nr:hypothetical protein [Anaerolineales bacterium]